MALFLPAFAGDTCIKQDGFGRRGPAHRRGLRDNIEPWLPLGIGLDYGRAFVGNVARFQGKAAPGQVVMSERVYQAVSGRYPQAQSVHLELKGKREPVLAHVVTVA